MAGQAPLSGRLDDGQQLGCRERRGVLWQQRLLAHDRSQQRHGLRCCGCTSVPGQPHLQQQGNGFDVIPWKWRLLLVGQCPP